MRYPQGGGLTERALREAIRLEAASRFAAGQNNSAIAPQVGWYRIDHSRAVSVGPRR
jgi:hypothetical protein